MKTISLKMFPNEKKISASYMILNIIIIAIYSF